MSRLALSAVTLAVAGLSLNASAQLNERTRSFYITQTQAGKSQNAGYTGAGVLVAVLDTGVWQAHPEFAGRLRRGKSFTGQGDQSIANDANGHGTHVAGIIAAARNNTSKGTMGMAYAATILPVKVLNKDGSGTTQMIADGLRFATSKGAPIVNMSLGTSSAFDATAFQEAVVAGQLIVAAAGNNAQSDPGWPARFAKENWANGQIIAVGAVDANNVMASFSNRAGDTADWYLVAPGVGIRSTWRDNGYARLSGTSMAAPVVTGAAAMIKGRWSYLSAAQIADLLFSTATDLGAPGTDAIYGRGLINVAAAMAPAGGLIAHSTNGTAVNVENSSLQVSSATAGLVTLARKRRLKVVAFDAYQRDFTLDLGAVLQRPAGSSPSASLAGADRRLHLTESLLPGGARLTLAHEQDRAVTWVPGSVERTPAQRLVAAGYEGGPTDSRHFVGFGLADQQFGLAAEGPGRALHGLAGVADPYLALLPQSAYLGWSGSFGAGRLRAGWLDSSLQAPVLDQYGPGASAARDAQAATVEFSHRLASTWMATASLARLHERASRLGAHGRGALALADASQTDTVGASLAWAPASGWTLGARMSWGHTAGSRTPDHLISAMSDQSTRGWALALSAQDHWSTGDRLGLSIEQPLRTERGNMTLDAAQAVGTQGQALRQVHSLSLVPSGREHKLTLSYGRPWAVAGFGGERIVGWADLALVLRQQPDHQEEADLDAAVMVRWQTAF